MSFESNSLTFGEKVLIYEDTHVIIKDPKGLGDCLSHDREMSITRIVAPEGSLISSGEVRFRPSTNQTARSLHGSFEYIPKYSPGSAGIDITAIDDALIQSDFKSRLEVIQIGMPGVSFGIAVTIGSNGEAARLLVETQESSQAVGCIQMEMNLPLNANAVLDEQLASEFITLWALSQQAIARSHRKHLAETFDITVGSFSPDETMPELFEVVDYYHSMADHSKGLLPYLSLTTEDIELLSLAYDMTAEQLAGALDAIAAARSDKAKKGIPPHITVTDIANHLGS